MTYTVAYALTTAMLVHTALWHGPRLWRGFRNQQVEMPDIHAKLMREYETVPRWWYSATFLVLFALSIVCVQVFDTDLPVWGLIIAILLPAIYFLPAAFIFASTAQIMTLNLVSQLIPGFAFAGRPVAVMVSAGDVRKPADKADVQNHFASDHPTGSGVRARYETRSLHEAAPKIRFLRPASRHDFHMCNSDFDKNSSV